MNLLEDVTQYLKSNNLVDSWTVFLESFMDTPDKAVCIYEYGNSYPHRAIQGSTRQLQIVTRSIKALEAKTKAFEIFKVLHEAGDRTDLTVDRWAQIAASKAPIKLKVDAKNRTYYVFNFTCTTRKF